jgi:hypothetical protein
MRKIILSMTLAAPLLSMCPDVASAGAPHCHPWGSSGYCQYDGRVVQAYVNAYHEVILYFDTPLNAADATNVGLAGVTVTNAAIYNTTSNPDFGKSLLAAMLSAQARGARVSVQMSSVLNGYLVVDRIWVME